MPAPNSEETISENDGELVLQDVDHPVFSVFHPDQLDQLTDIQEELARLESIENEGIEEVVTMSMDDSVVDHEVIINTQTDEEEQTEESILPDMSGESDFLKDDVLTLTSNNAFSTEVESFQPQVMIEEQNIEDLVLTSESIMVPQDNCTINSAEDVPQIINPSSVIYTVPSGTMKLQTSTASLKRPISFSNLKAIRPIMTAKKSPTLLQPRNIITKLILQNSYPQQGQPVLINDTGHQTVRIIGGSVAQPTNVSTPKKTITLAQARQMGLQLPEKLQQILPSNAQKNLVLNKGIINQTQKTVTVVKSPTKILPLPTTSQLHTIAPLPTLNTTSSVPQKFFIQQGSTFKTGTFTPTPGQVFRIPSAQGPGSGQIHQIQLPGKQVQYVKILKTNHPGVQASGTTTSGTQTIITKNQIATSIPITSKPMPVPVALSTNLKLLPVLNQGQQANQVATKLIMNPIRPMNSTATTSVVQATSLSNIVMVPAQFVQQLTTTSAAPTTVAPQPQPVVSTAQTQPMLIKPKENVVTATESSSSPKVKTLPLLDQPNGIRPRKPCNCTKSQCLKLYCDCFANGEFCFQCNCNSCFNNLDHEEDRQRAIKSCLDRNPNAFRPKIGKSYVGDERRHNKGCNCKRSGCLKNYCECYEAKIPCSNNCKCVGCRNVEEAKSLRDLASVAEEKLLQQKSSKYPLDYEIQDIAFRPHNSITIQGPKQPFNQLLTQEVVEATCQILLALKDRASSTEEAKCLILEEFGQCLRQIINCAATKQTSNSATT
uniref:CRC domain-containing protein n=1 Tax=Clastoptera arizonana TaxID=38151 RepID=A0A1B6DQ28_9HEMI